jgi:hypothetical protein
MQVACVWYTLSGTPCTIREELRIHSCRDKNTAVNVNESNHFFLGLFGVGDITRITIKMMHTLQSCLFVSYKHVYCSLLLPPYQDSD